MGKRLGRYELVGRLGRGGMGDVWEAVLCGPEGFRKPVALKLLRLPGGRHRKLLASEARLGAMLSHPNVLATYELGWASRDTDADSATIDLDDEGVWFIAMELVRGASLSQLLGTGPLSAPAIVDVGVQTCAGLAHIHAMGLLHRDIKLGNLLVDRTGLLKIADLGIARLQSEALEGTAGTPAYMAPEQFEGSEDARSDLFALGGVLYRLAIGKPPFGKGASAMSAGPRIERAIHAPAFLEPLDAVLPGLGDLLQRCLRRAPGDRWESAGQLAAALRALRKPGGRTLIDQLITLRPELGPDDGATVAPTATSPGARRLPKRRDTFVGRAAELADLTQRVAGAPGLLSVVGTGGMGKTRLALEVAHNTTVPGGAIFCALEPATTLAGLCHAVAAGLGVPLGDDDPVEQVGRAIGGLGRVMLVLDNLEQVIDAAAAALDVWLELAPEASLVATSRVPLRVRGEKLLSLAPLEIDDAVELFMQRAPRPGDDLELVRTLVERLDAMPLAIELAAARTRLMGVQAVLERLTDRFRLLAGGGRDLPERQRSLRASLDASWELLDAEARSTLAQLSVFRGGFTLEAADAVVDLGGAWVLDPLSTLIDHSLVRRTTEERFGLLVSVGEYAALRLSDPERAAAERRHSAYYASFGSPDHFETLHRHGGPARLKALAGEMDNLVAAARHSAGVGAAVEAAGCAMGAFSVLRLRGPFETARELLEAALALPDCPRRGELQLGLVELGESDGDLVAAAVMENARRDGDRALEGSALYRMASVATSGSRLDDAERLWQASLEAFQDAGLADRCGSALAGLARVARRRGDTQKARELYSEAVDVHKRTGNRVAEAVTLANLGAIVEDLGDMEQARELLELALAMHRELGNVRYEALALQSLASLHSDRTDPEEGLAFYQAALDAHRRVGARGEIGTVLANLGLHLRDMGRHDDAADALQEAMALHRELDNVLAEAVTTGNLALLREDMGDPEAAEILFAEAIALAEQSGHAVWVAIERGYRGRLLVEQGRYDEADPDLQAAVDGAEGQHLHAYVGFLADLAVARAGRGLRVSELMATAEAAMGTSDPSPRHWLCKARVAHLSGDEAGFVEAMELADAALDAAEISPVGPLRTLRDRVAAGG